MYSNDTKFQFDSQAIIQNLLSGFGGYHTANPKRKKPKPYSKITIKEIADMAAKPPSVAKDQAQWMIPSTTIDEWARIHSYQREMNRGRYV